MAKDSDLIGGLILEIEALKRRVDKLESGSDDSGVYLEGSPDFVKDFYKESKIKDTEVKK